MNEKWFALGIPQVEKKLKTNAASGLSRKAARSRVDREAGSVFLLPKKSVPLIVADVFADLSLIILLLAAVISLFFEEFLSGIPVLCLTVGYLLVMGYCYYRSHRTTESLGYLFAPTAHVVRGGRLYCVNFRSLAVGDVILVESGDVLCCDARIVTSDRLRVQMRLDRERFCSLDKYSDGHVNPNARRAEEMSNMLHAGSVVEQGSARAIVTAVGKYTYLGAMTGGIPYAAETELPDTLQNFRRVCGKVNMILLLAVLPFSLISLLFSYMGGGTVLLSASFLTAIAIAATTMSQLSCRLLRIFYTKKMKELLTHPDPSVIRSVKALDQLASADYLFLTDGCALTDGVLHFRAAACAEGEIRNREAANATAKYFFELVSLYHTAATGSVTTGISGAGGYFPALRELIQACGVDREALKIRCSVRSYSTGNLFESEELVCLTDQGRTLYLHVSCAPDAIAKCGSLMLGGVRQSMSEEGRRSLEQMRRGYEKQDRAPLIFSVSFDSLSEAPCFVGMVAIREGVDPNLARNVARLERMGCRVISFLPKDPSAPSIPTSITDRGVVSKEDFIKHHQPITYRFGSFRCYADLDREDIMTLLKHARSMGKRVLLMSFSEAMLPLAEQADGFVTCTPISIAQTGDGDEELQSLEIPGRQYSESCTQFLKEKAQYLIPRPTAGRGGLASLAAAMARVKGLYANLSAFQSYWVWSQLIRLLLAALPMLFGQTILDARHILFCGCLLDGFAFWLFSGRPAAGAATDVPNYCAVTSPKEYFRMDRPMLFATLAACGSCFVFPRILDLTGFADQFLYRSEFFFSALIFLHLTVLLMARLGTSVEAWKRSYRELPLILMAVVVAVFLALCAGWLSFGILFEWEENPLPYFLVSLLPSAVFAIVVLALKQWERRGKRSAQA